MLAHMTADEADLFAACLARARRILEFGCGGSTLLALSNEAASVWSVDNVPEWIEKVSAEPLAKEALRSRRLKFIRVDTGPTGAWGRPASEEHRDWWPRYHTKPWRRVPAETLDLIFIDGRFRVACTVQAILRAKDDCVICIHDFWNRPRYEVLLEFLDVRDRVDTLGVFSIAQPRRIGDLIDCLLARQYDFR